jgi:RNA polymerase sigma-70 factor (ECF subfamily)
MRTGRTGIMDGSECELIRELYPSLRRFAAVVRPPEIEPDDLVQEAFYQALRRGPLTNLSNPTAYLRRTMTNLASNHRRRLGRGRLALIRYGAGQPAFPEYPSDVSELLRLAPRSRAVLYMRAVEGRSFPEIAECLGCSEAAARAVERRARRKLRAALSEEEVRDARA